MSADLPAGLRDKVAIALHDAECGDRHCNGSALGAYYRQADVALEAAADAIAERAAADERVRIRQPLPHTLSVLRSQVHAAIEEWHDEPDQNYANGVSITDAVMRVVGPVLQLVHGSHAGLLADAPDGTVAPGDAT